MVNLEDCVCIFLQTTFPKTKTREDVYEILKKENNDGKTPLKLAIENGNVRSVRIYYFLLFSAYNELLCICYVRTQIYVLGPK